MNSKIIIAARILLGLAFVVFGLNGFLHFIPLPPMSGAPGALMGALVASGYLFALVKLVEVVTGLLILSGFFVPLALILLAPVMVNIIAFHLFLEPSGLLIPVILLALHLYLAWSYRSAYQGVLRAK